MSQLTLQTHVADIVTAVPQSADLFRALRIDFCCGGKIPLEEAAITRKLDSSAVLDQIRTLETKGGVSGQPAWRSGGTGADRIHSEQASRFFARRTSRVNALYDKAGPRPWRTSSGAAAGAEIVRGFEK